MPQQISPFLEVKFGWDYGESGWNGGTDENWLKFSYLFDSNIDGVVSALPPEINGKAYFNSEDNRVYFVVNGSYLSTPIPKWHVLKDRESGAYYEFTGATLVETSNLTEIDSSISETQDQLAYLMGQNGSDYIDYDNETISSALSTTKTFSSYADVRAYNGSATACTILNGRAFGRFKIDDSDTTSIDNGGTIIVDGMGRRWKRLFTGATYLDWFLPKTDGTDPVGNSAIILAAVESMRTGGTSIIQYIGGPNVISYISGTLKLGEGVYAFAPDTLNFSQESHLTIQGQGSRGKNQAINAKTTLLIKGPSSGFGIRHFGNGARSLTLKDMDICYETSDFTGDVLDSYSSPGLLVENCRIGCYGGFSATRVQTARSLIRATYDEFLTVRSTVLDGGQLGFWSDNSRVLAGAAFGGWGVNFTATTFYDIADSMVRHDGTRSKSAVSFVSCAFNPINISPVRAFDIDNIEGLVLQGCQFTPSTSSQPTEQWLKILGSTGVVDSNTFSGPSSKVGTVGGSNPTAIRWSNNRIACLDGLTITGGVLTGSGNEYSNSTHGLEVVPAAVITLDVGPDIFKAGVLGNSYRISADNALLGGRINYISEQDNSVNKFLNTSSRITVENVDKRISTISSLPATGNITFTGRTYNITAAGTFTLPAPQPGTRLRIVKSTATALTVASSAGSNFAVGESGTRTSAVATASDVGSQIEAVALNASTWLISKVAGTWTFS